MVYCDTESHLELCIASPINAQFQADTYRVLSYFGYPTTMQRNDPNFFKYQYLSGEGGSTSMYDFDGQSSVTTTGPANAPTNTAMNLAQSAAATAMQHQQQAIFAVPHEPDYVMHDVPSGQQQQYSLPPSGIATTSSSSRSTTDFRRRRNWSERILHEITGLLHVLSPATDILHCSKSSCFDLTGYAPEELTGRPLTEFLHVDDIDIFLRDFNRAFRTRTQIKTVYRFRKKDDSYVLFETIGHPRTDAVGQPPQTFFALAQPYPTRMDSLLDSLLELKMENEWLKQRLREIVPPRPPLQENIPEQQFSYQEAEGSEQQSLMSVGETVWLGSNIEGDDRHHSLMAVYSQSHLQPTAPAIVGLSAASESTMERSLNFRDKWKRRVSILYIGRIPHPSPRKRLIAPLITEETKGENK